MKLVTYKEDGSFATSMEGINNPKLTGGLLTFENGSISGINDNHIFLDDENEIPNTLEEAKFFDKRAGYIVEEVDELAELKKQLQAAREENEMNALALMELAQMVLGG